MEIHQRYVEGITVLDLAGHIDGNLDARYFWSALNGATSHVVLNFSQVDSIDNNLFAMINTYLRHFFEKKKYHVVLAELSTAMKTDEPIMCMALQRTFQYWDTESDAITYLQSIGKK